VSPQSQARLLLALAYQGGRFSGSQLQPVPQETVQGVLLAALRQLGLQPSNGRLSGRTDAGVHARLQYYTCWVNPGKHADAAHLARRLTAVLPPDVTVWTATYLPEADSQFDVLRSVAWRWYRYRIQLSEQSDCWLPPDMAHQRIKNDVDESMLHTLAQSLQGAHQFLAFQNTDTPVTNTECHVLGARWTRLHPHQWQFDIVADRFVYNMVRNLVAEQLAVATGQQSWTVWQQRLAGQPRQSGQLTAKAKGLTLMMVYYPLCFRYFREHTVILQLEQKLKALELLDENLFCQTTRR
jgi:tRNA pseudouridine38-40 synthase